MAGRPYRAAIIGTGRIGSLLERDPRRSRPHTHAGWYAACPRTELVAGADLDPGRLASFGDDWQVPADRLFADYREMLDRVRPDIVSICGYAPERREMVEAAVAAGARGLWVEKAVACSLPEVEAIDSCVRRAGVAVVVDQPRRGDARYVAVRDTIASGELGRLQSVHVVFSGHVVHTGVHAWDVLRLWLGDWLEARAWLDAESHDDEADEARRGGEPGPDAARERLASRLPADALTDRGGHAHLRFPNDVHVFCSAALRRYFIFQFDLLFDRGRLRIGNDVDERQHPVPSPRYSGFLELEAVGRIEAQGPSRTLLDDLLQAMDIGRPPAMSLDHASAALTLALALFQSDREGHATVTPETLARDLYVASI